jgi:hypothetical protein
VLSQRFLTDAVFFRLLQPVAHFGLGKVEGNVTIRVSWPDGQWVVRANVSPNTFVTLPHPSKEQVKFELE